MAEGKLKANLRSGTMSLMTYRMPRSAVLGSLLSILVTGCSVAPSKSSAPAALATADASLTADKVPVFSPFHPLTTSDEKVVGDPNVAGRPFVIRVRELPGTVVPPHTHHFDENLTIVQGTWYFGIGPKFDRAALHQLSQGSFVFIPRGTPMFGYSPDDVTVQVHGIGPFEQHFVDSLYVLVASVDADDDALVDPARFRFRLGQTVRSPRGRGRIRQGYATGSVVQYQIVVANGRLIMAQEQELDTP
jgi:quercetin dioxygenase-like cupin family protein